MVRLSKAQRKAQAKLLSAKWNGNKSKDSIVRVKDMPRRKHGIVIQVKA